MPFALVVGALASGSDAFFAAAAEQDGWSGAVSDAAVALIVSPIRTFLSLYFHAGLTHLGLIVVRGRHRPFRETLHCVAYSIAPYLLAVTPITHTVALALALVALGWQLVVLAIAIGHVHGTSIVRAVCGAVGAPLVLAALALSLRGFVIEAFKIPSGAMIPTLQVGDHIFVSKSDYLFGSDPSRGDVIVFEFPGDPSKDFVKRVAGVAGDEVSLRGAQLLVNGRAIRTCRVGPTEVRDEGPFGVEVEPSEEFLEWLGETPSLAVYSRAMSNEEQGPWRVPSDAVFVLGDNRDNSHDSRFWGSVPLSSVKGRAQFVWWSNGTEGIRWDRIGTPIHAPPRASGARAERLRRCLGGSR